MLSPTAMKEKEGRKKRNGGKKIKRKEEATNVRTNVDTSALDGAALSFQLHEPWHGYYLFNASRTALHNYLHRVAWSSLGPWMEDAYERGRKKDGHMRVFNAHEPRLVRETSARIDSVHKCVQARRNAADLYKQSDPHCRTCMQRGIFARFFVLTVSACLLALPLYPSVYHCSPSILFPNSYDSISFLRFSSRIIG